MQLMGDQKDNFREKTELFFQAANAQLQELLKPLFEVHNEERNLKIDWKGVVEAIPLLARRQQ